MALWRETLLAKKVLEGGTKGYSKHPQLLRFQQSEDPIVSINTYLFFVLEEAGVRRYSFDREKIEWEKCRTAECFIPVNSEQLDFEVKHLLSKLQFRDKERFEQYLELTSWEPHPLFNVVPGEIESWEKT